ncbi:hypothetical protein D3C81_1489920 [compost metagenome]
MDRQQLHRRHAEPVQVIDETRIGQRGEGAAMVRQQVFAQHGRAAHMHLVDRGFRPWPVQRAVIAPVEALVDNHGLRHHRRAVAAVWRQVCTRAVEPIAEQRVGPAHRAAQQARVGVQQQLVRIEALAPAWLVGAVGAVTVQHAGLGQRQVAVPDLVGAFGQRQALDLLAAVGRKQAQLDACGVGGEDREVDAQAVPMRAKGVGLAGQQTVDGGNRHVHGSFVLVFLGGS